MSVTVKGAISGSQRNSGIHKVETRPDIMGVILLVPKGTTGPRWTAGATAATINAAVKTWLLAQGVNNTFANRMQVLGPIISLEDKSTAATYQQFNLGSQVKTDDGKYIFDVMYREGGMTYAQAMRSYDGQSEMYDAMFLSHKGQIRGVCVTTTDSLNNVTVTGVDAFPLEQLDFEKVTEATKDKEAGFKCVLSPAFNSHLNDDACIVDLGDSTIVKQVCGARVTDVLLTSMGTGTAGVYTVNVTTADGKVNLASGPYALSWTAGCFKTLRDSTGNVISITSIAVVGNSIAITCDTGDADYTLHATIRVSLQSVSAVYAILGGYYEAPTIYMAD